ncbi:4'-phosphopantetheinyl transferase family protein [Cohnella panacarvi]|uniref:4'-phosphopantetheinyl transferase family protein n=1 Tax=Cohnella panacarvi TaxID=400776 RepID=UPI00047E54DA|nr:4'-phosphopantetheinyl transferase superfamily protein [Cohnella panacarvi]
MRTLTFDREAESVPGAGDSPHGEPKLGLYAVDVSRALTADMQVSFTELCSPRRRARLGRFRHPDDAKRSLMAEMLARAAIGAEWLPEHASGELAFGQDRYGKPYLIGHSELHFNLSHSGRWCACAVSTAPVGVDVEQVRPMELSWTDKFLSADEREDLRAIGESDRLWRFYELWTRKESYAKAMGRGLTPELLSVSVAEGGAEALAPYRIRSSCLDDSHPAAVCAALPELRGDWTVWTPEEIAARVLRRHGMNERG